ncbi:MAG: DUF896 domain-containing protein [Oscillospiraceae bacterium]|nr:DUF896 domain-containing protein [Oscillospiraceae bacterium]
MTQEMIDRINFLAKKSRTEQGLTPEEKEEQASLRKEYVEAMRASLRGQLDSTVVVYPDGSRKKLSDMKKQKK